MLITICLGGGGGKEGSANYYFSGREGGWEGGKSNYIFFGIDWGGKEGSLIIICSLRAQGEEEV